MWEHILLTAHPSWYIFSPVALTFAILYSRVTCSITLSILGILPLLAWINFKIGPRTESLILQFARVASGETSIPFWFFRSQWRHKFCCSRNLPRTISLSSHIFAKPSREKWWEGSGSGETTDTESDGEWDDDEEAGGEVSKGSDDTLRITILQTTSKIWLRVGRLKRSDLTAAAEVGKYLRVPGEGSYLENMDLIKIMQNSHEIRNVCTQRSKIINLEIGDPAFRG